MSSWNATRDITVVYHLVASDLSVLTDVEQRLTAHGYTVERDDETLSLVATGTGSDTLTS